MQLVDFKTKFFFDSEPVKRQLDKETRKVLTRSGGKIRIIAQRSMRPARRKRESELTTQEKADYARKVRIARQKGRPKPKRPYASAAPGEPPRTRNKLLRKNIFFGWDTASESIVIGAIQLPRLDHAKLIEHGGNTTAKNVQGQSVSMTYKPHPFMQPALRIAAPTIPPEFRNIL